MVKDIVGNKVVIPIGQVLVSGGKNIRLNTEGAFFIKHIVANKSEKEIIDLYSELFSVDTEVAKEELDEFYEYGKECGFLTEDTIA